ncbi:hypothetical protein A8C32_14570 [Flavivirga aquatica]|uniref:Bacteriocin n=1 Tax=Flavivirga aquatica TaxID=1849968 RepID=A0A1E5TCK7_9FLAO|nr:hypothetical protein [Flavivirga aquatica]OEK09104.1 hypothetical protein A8C32_14570 [Flavivirga aquatica]
MKKLELKEMENLQGGIEKWRKVVGCAIMGTTMSIANPFLGIGFGMWCNASYEVENQLESLPILQK